MARNVLLALLLATVILLQDIAHGLKARCSFRSDCTGGQRCYRRQYCHRPLYNPPPVRDFFYISEIQGPGTISPLAGNKVTTIGVVTAINNLTQTPSVWLQDLYEDEDPRTSEAIYLFRPTFTPQVVPEVGDVVEVCGTVAEFVPSSRPEDLPVTELVNSKAKIVGSIPLRYIQPAAFDPETPLSSFGSGSGYEEDSEALRTNLVNGNYTCSTVRESAICFYEAHEHMLVAIKRARTVTAELRFGEIGVASRQASWLLPRSPPSAVVTATDFKPNVITVEDDLVPRGSRNFTAGTNLKAFRGVLFYSFSQYKVYNTEPLEQQQKASVQVPMKLPYCNEKPNKGTLRLATWNLENRDPLDDEEGFRVIGQVIEGQLCCPDILGLSEIGDNDGSARSNVTSASVTLQLLADKANFACRVSSYKFSDIDPVNLADGGQPGENIRVAFLYRSDSVVLAPGRPKGGPVDAVDIRNGRLTLNPGRISPSQFPNSRKPLVAEFEFVSDRSRRIMIVMNHWNSKFGDDALFGRVQPPLQESQEKRLTQASAVRSFLDGTPRNGVVVVMGDLNDFYFSTPVQTLGLKNLWSTLPSRARYSFVFQSRLQTLDHILVGGKCLICGRLRVAHIATELPYGSPGRVSDHDALMSTCQWICA
ncbi:Endonuclease/exonuclease/phosphatase [Gracilaria domingensis]|nr:Endonuclease/exonuclease/phosphatase [Gracilaria domingensis]